MAKATRRKKDTSPEPQVTEAEDTEEEEDVFEELEDEETESDTDEESDDEESDEDNDLEELEEPEEEEEAPAPAKKTKGKAKTGPKHRAKSKNAPAFGSKELAEHITSTTGHAYDARSVRMLLRRLAKDPNSPLRRSVGEDRERYSFSGPEDPTVKAIVQMVESGEAQRIKREGLEAVKAKAEANKATKKTSGKKAKVQEEEVVEETAPAKKTAKRAKATEKAAPAKATTKRRAK